MATPSTQPKPQTAPPPPDAPTSALGEPKQRFLSQVVAHSLAVGRRTAKDFLRHFPPKAIMVALRDQPQLRSAIVVPTTGIHGKVAQKKAPESLAEDIQIALDEGVADEHSIVALFDPDDRVRFLDPRKLWQFVAEGEFWKKTSGLTSGGGTPGGELAATKQHIAFILDCAKSNGLLSELDLVDGCGMETLLERLPKAVLEKLVRGALLSGRQGKPFDDEKVLEVAPPRVLVDHLPLAHLWDAIVIAKVLTPTGYLTAPATDGEAKKGSVPPPPVQAPSSGTKSKDSDAVLEVLDSGDDAPEDEETVVTLSPRMRPIRARDADPKPDTLAGSGKAKH
jgi:hypothetical protein